MHTPHNLPLRLPHPAYFVGIALVSSAVCVIALRQNNQHMIQLRDEVYATDQAGGDVQGSLTKLQTYVTSHMNTNLSTGNTSVYPPIQLKYTYERLVKAQSDQVAAANTAVYTSAQRECEAQNSTDVSGRNRIPCIEAYVTSHTATAKPINDSLYKFAFATPTWSPDLAGWSMVTAATSAVLFVVSAISRRFRRK